jgi:hypothetical protein
VKFITDSLPVNRTQRFSTANTMNRFESHF